jgi:Ca-activated chloride channel homolog
VREGSVVTFLSPWLLLSLLVVAAAALGYPLLERRRSRYVVYFTNVDVLASVAGRSRGYRRHLVATLVLVSLAALCVAAARPTVTVAAPLDRATVVLVLDVSGSMRAEDVAPTRLAAAQGAIERFLDEVPSSLRVGLVAFSDDPQVIAVPTTDHDAVRANLELVFPQRGTAIGDALARAVELARDAVHGSAEQGGTAETGGQLTTPDGKPLATVLLLSDGAQMGGVLEPLDGARLATEAGVPVYTIGLGTDEGVVEFFRFGEHRVIQVPPDRETLAQIAEATGGEYYDAPSAERLGDVYAGLGSRLGRVDERREVSAFVLAGGAVLLAGAGLLAVLWRPPLP